MKSLIDQQSNFTVVTTVHVRHALSVHRVNACTARRMSRLPYDTSISLPVTLRDDCPANCLCASCLSIVALVITGRTIVKSLIPSITSHVRVD